MTRIRIATYNIHKCVGMDRRYSPERIVDVLREIDADIVALQEVLCHSQLEARDHQAAFIADELGMDFRLGENRRLSGGDYGNAVLSRLPITSHANHDISVKKYEPRGCLSVEIEAGEPIRFMNVHMGTSYFERRSQVHKLLEEPALRDANGHARRIIAGDFNEWVAGVTTRLLRSRFNYVDPKLHLGRTRTFPGIVPVVHLDHVYFDDTFRLVGASVHRSLRAMIASDHLPIVADLEFE